MPRYLKIFGVLVAYAIFVVVVLALVDPNQLGGYLPLILFLVAGFLLIPIARTVQNQRMERVFIEMQGRNAASLNSIEFSARCRMRLSQAERFLDHKMQELGGCKEKDEAWGEQTKGGYYYMFNTNEKPAEGEI
jgi:hypothetical protein